MLIKAWCYHESRILGAHHGLLSTYALETLVLYIFNIFHKSLHGPLEALYKFLEYFSKFDWDKYCISLNGPVLLSSLPSPAVEPSSIQDELLFGKKTLPEVSDGSNINFCLKHLNIIDPLKWSNNLGRSVSRGSFYRIRGALSFGAQKLGQILMLHSDLIPTEIFGFFANTLKRHGRGERSDVGNNDSIESLLDPEYALGKDAPDFTNSDRNQDENRNPNLQTTSYRYFHGDAKDHPWNKIWLTNFDIQYYNMVSGASLMSHSTSSTENGNHNIKQRCSRSLMEQQIYASNQPHILTPSTHKNTLDVINSCRAELNRSDLHEEKVILSPFSPSNLLDLSGDLDLHLRCLQKIQYHLESMFDGLVQLIQEAFLSGLLDEDSFKIPTRSFSNSTDERPTGLLPVASVDTGTRNLCPVSYFPSTGDVSHKSHTEDQVNAVCQKNVVLSSGTCIISNGFASSPSPPADLESYPVSWFHNTQEIMAHGTGMQTLKNVSLLPGTDVLSNVVGQLPFLAADSENYSFSRSHNTREKRVMRGTGTFLPRMSYYTYKERILSEKGRRERERLPDRPWKIKTNPTGYLHQHTSPEVGCSGASTGGITIDQNSSQQDYSRSSVPAEGGVFQKRALINHVSEQIQTSLPWDVHNNQHGYVYSDMNMVDNQNPGTTSEGLVGHNSESRELPIHHPPEVQFSETMASSPCILLPHCIGNGQGNLLQESNTCQPFPPATDVFHSIKTKQDENLEVESFRPIPFSSPCAKFGEAFPLPTSKGPAETESRPDGLYQLRDEADFPPLQTRSC
ncbi:hypothetical protein DAI22_12g096600 [Oryza sativa Japonica Group]|jgi:hypothetical protein|nr:hypothetical protein DAI22_12g096600 [Oryza sativa Japonica Group]